MGNIDSHSQESNTLLQDYTELRKENGGTVLMAKKTGGTYFLKESIFTAEEPFRMEMKRIESLQSGEQNENILPIHKISNQTYNNICSKSFRIYVIYEYPSITLQEEIEARSKESKHFDESELWSILHSCVNAMNELKPSLSLHPHNIFIVSDGVLKVINNEMIDEEIRCFFKKGVYYAPERIEDFQKTGNEPSITKEAIFSLGMTLLHAALLKPVDDCYKYENEQFLNDKLENYIEEVAKMNNENESEESGYSSDFIEVLAMILEPNPNKRASLMEINGILNKVWNTETEEQTELKEEDSNQCQYESRQKPDQSINQSLISQTKLLEEKSFHLPPSSQLNSNKKINSNIKLGNSNFDERESKSSLISSNSGKGLKMNFETNLVRSIHYDKYPDTLQEQSNKENGLYTDPKLLEMIKKDLHDLNELKRSSMINAYGGYSNNSRVGPSNNYSEIGENKNGAFSSKHSIVEVNYQQSYKNSTDNVLKQRSSNASITTGKQYEEIKEISNQQIKPQKQPNFSKIAKNAVYVVEEDEEGRKFSGTLVNGEKEGFGKLTYSDGAYYEGYFKMGKMDGEGTLYYEPEKPAYQGSWQEDQFHGYGILFNETPLQLKDNFNFNDFNLIEDFWVRYEGAFDCDNKSGDGKLILSNGEEFYGVFKNDFINGKGVFITKDGEEIEGFWEDNILVQLNA